MSDINEEYVQALNKAWKGSKTPYDPEKPPYTFAAGFIAGLKLAKEIIIGTDVDRTKINKLIKDGD